MSNSIVLSARVLLALIVVATLFGENADVSENTAIPISTNTLTASAADDTVLSRGL